MQTCLLVKSLRKQAYLVRVPYVVLITEKHKIRIALTHQPEKMVSCVTEMCSTEDPGDFPGMLPRIVINDLRSII